MAYIGNTQLNQNYVPAIDYFSGNGSTTAFTLSRPVASVAQVQAVIENVPQNPGDAYTVSGNTITFTSAPPSGTNNIYIYYTSPNTQVTALPQSPVVYGNLNFGSTGARIQGDFSNATIANQVYVQTSTSNAASTLYIVPNGTGNASGFSSLNSSDTVNYSRMTMSMTNIDARLVSTIGGTGTYLPMTFYTGGSERMKIDTSGNVGIGTSTAGSKFAVVTGSATGSAIPSWSTNYAIFGPNAGSSTGAAVGVSYNTTADQGEVISVSPNNAWKPLVLFGGGIRFNGTNGGESARIDSSGNVLVGRTSTVSSPGSSGKLFVDGGTIINTNGTDTSAYGLDRIAFNTSNYYVLNNSSTGVRLGSGSTSWAAQSDERLKDIIEPIENATEKVSSLRAVIGKYKSDEDGVRRSFLIAQDLQKVLPEAVDSSTLPDGEDETEYLYIKYTEVVPLLVAAIQELKAIVDEQAEKIKALEAK